jgi:hypothetical protein
MSRFVRNNGLSIVLFGLFFVFVAGQSVAGLARYNEERQEHRRPSVSYGDYLRSGDFIESVFENWESEFLQMTAFVMLSAALSQRGAAESRDPDGEPELDADPLRERTADSPWPVRHGGVILALYGRSLSIALFSLFALSFFLHAVGGLRRYNEDALNHGQPLVGLFGYLGSSTFWFESLQNWQSEFLSVGALVVLSIFLRQKGSPESKPVHAPHSQTGT